MDFLTFWLMFIWFDGTHCCFSYCILPSDHDQWMLILSAQTKISIKAVTYACRFIMVYNGSSTSSSCLGFQTEVIPNPTWGYQRLNLHAKHLSCQWDTALFEWSPFNSFIRLFLETTESKRSSSYVFNNCHPSVSPKMYPKPETNIAGEGKELEGA